MNFREATLLDLGALTKLRADMLREEEDHPEAFIDLLVNNTIQYIEAGMADRSYCAWVAEEDGAIVAMGGATYFALPPNDWCPSGKTAYISSIYTRPAYRKQGTATRLVSLLIEEAKAQKCQRIMLNASDKGKPLYEKLGFVDFPAAMALYPFGLKSEE